MDIDKEKLIPSHGGYRNLKSFQISRTIYDATVLFCNKFVDRKSRTHDQMVQAARSGVQNIAEGSLASATSKKTELKLTGVARASLGELLLDFEDYLRQHKLWQWQKDDPEALKTRAELLEKSDWSDLSDMSDWRFANTMICLINQASYLLFKQMKNLEENFKQEGGFTEKLYRVRQNIRKSF